jgi:hypothetical protein
MEMVPAVRRHLLNLPVVEGYVNDGVFADQLHEGVDRTGKRAIVVRDAGNGWAQPDVVQSGEFPLLAIDYWADCSRNTAGDRLYEDAVSNARAMHRAVDPFLHGHRDEWWGTFGSSQGLRVVSCARWREPVTQTKWESHGGIAYGMQLGESAVVTVLYALHVHH